MSSISLAGTGSLGLSIQEKQLLNQLDRPKKIQDFLETIPINYEPEGDTCLSPREVLKQRRAHCIEGAMLAALALRVHGHRPLLLDLTSARHDFDHVVAVFGTRGAWGAISKTNHAVLRYREPIYRTLHELALSYFHEYFDDAGRKTLRSYSDAVDLTRVDARGWMTSEKNVWYVVDLLNAAPHHGLLTRSQLMTLRQADAIEQQAGRLIEWPNPKEKKH